MNLNLRFEMNNIYPDTSNLGISCENASAISRLPIFAIHCNAKLTWTGFLDCKSFLMLWIINLIKSLFVFTRTEMKRYP